jgi:hypothetical protein
MAFVRRGAKLLDRRARGLDAFVALVEPRLQLLGVRGVVVVAAHARHVQRHRIELRGLAVVADALDVDFVVRPESQRVQHFAIRARDRDDRVDFRIPRHDRREVPAEDEEQRHHEQARDQPIRTFMGDSFSPDDSDPERRRARWMRPPKADSDARGAGFGRAGASQAESDRKLRPGQGFAKGGRYLARRTEVTFQENA